MKLGPAIRGFWEKHKKRCCLTAVLLILCLIIGLILYEAARKDHRELQPREDVYELKILFPQSGSLSSVADEAAWAVSYAQSQINKNGGIGGLPLEISLIDTGFDDTRALSLAKSAIEGQRILIGPLDAPGTTVISALARENGIAHIAAYSYPELREQTAPYGISYMSDTAEGELESIRLWCALNPDLKQVVIMISQGDTSQASTASGIYEIQGDLGIEICDIIEIGSDARGGLNAAIQALNAKPQGYIFLGRASEYAVVLKELRKRGVTDGRCITASFSAYDNALLASIPELLEGTYIWSKFDVSYPGETWQALLEDYRTDHEGRNPSSSTVPDFYNAIYAWKTAVEALGLPPVPVNLEEERSRVAEWFYNSETLDGIQGKYRWVNGKKENGIYYFRFNPAGEPEPVS